MHKILFFLWAVFSFAACQSESEPTANPDNPNPIAAAEAEQANAIYPTLPQPVVNELLTRCDQIDYIFSDLGVSMKATGPEARQNLQHIAAVPVKEACAALLGQAVFQGEGEIITIAQVYYQPPNCSYFVFEVEEKQYANEMTQAGIKRFRDFQNLIQSRKNQLKEQGLEPR